MSPLSRDDVLRRSRTAGRELMVNSSAMAAVCYSRDKASRPAAVCCDRVLQRSCVPHCSVTGGVAAVCYNKGAAVPPARLARGWSGCCVTTETRPLDRLGQLGEFEQDSNTDSELERNTDSHSGCCVTRAVSAREQPEGRRDAEHSLGRQLERRRQTISGNHRLPRSISHNTLCRQCDPSCGPPPVESARS